METVSGGDWHRKGYLPTIFDALLEEKRHAFLAHFPPRRHTSFGRPSKVEVCEVFVGVVQNVSLLLERQLGRILSVQHEI